MSEPHAGEDGADRGLSIHELDAREPVVDNPASSPTWRHLLGGPVIWVVHFLVVYLVGEQVCRNVATDEAGRSADSELVTFVVIATAVGVALCLVTAAVSWRALPRDAGGEREPIGTDTRLTAAGVALSLGSALTVLAVGLPAIWVGPC